MGRPNTGGLPCKTAARRGGARVYSPGGCGCALLMFPVVAAGAGIALALSGVALMAAVCLIIAVGITVYFAATANRRREQGKTLGGWIIIPVAICGLNPLSSLLLVVHEPLALTHRKGYS